MRYADYKEVCNKSKDRNIRFVKVRADKSCHGCRRTIAAKTDALTVNSRFYGRQWYCENCVKTRLSLIDHRYRLENKAVESNGYYTVVQEELKRLESQIIMEVWGDKVDKKLPNLNNLYKELNKCGLMYMKGYIHSDKAMKDEVLAYMDSALIYEETDKYEYDVYTDELVKLHTRLYTDGHYTWSGIMMYYVEQYSLELPRDFIDRAVKDKVVDVDSITGGGLNDSISWKWQ